MLVAIAAFGGLNTCRAALSAWAAPQQRQGLLPPWLSLLIASLRNSYPPGNAIIDKDSGCTRIRMHADRKASDIGPIALRKEWQEPDAGMFHGMQCILRIPTCNVELLAALL